MFEIFSNVILKLETIVTVFEQSSNAFLEKIVLLCLETVLRPQTFAVGDSVVVFFVYLDDRI